MTLQQFQNLSDQLVQISHRLDVLENPVMPTHPSVDKFQIGEAIADGIFGTKEKACTFEPSKPCDHCLMCNSRGF